MPKRTRRAPRTRSRTQTLGVAWTFGLLAGIVVWILRRTGFIEIRGFSREKFVSQQGKGVIVYHRHPSMLETMIIPVLFFPRFLWDPYKIPLSVPDKKNFYDPWWMRPLRIIAIPMPRGHKTGEGLALRQMVGELQKGRSIVVAFEGGRTWKGSSFKQRKPDGTIETWERLTDQDETIDLSETVIRRFSGGKGIEYLARGQTPFLPIWVDIQRRCMGRKIRIVVGDLVSVPPEEDVTDFLENLLLQTAEG